MKNFIHNNKLKTAVLVFFLILGSSYIAFADYYRDLSSQLRLFTDLYKELVVNYVDQVNPDALINAGIEGMLETLDPYTVYLEKEDQHGIKTLTEGKYGGVGIRLGVRNDTLTVIAPMEGSPAMRAGVQAGDKIIQVDTLKAVELRLSKAASKMRGEPGTKVTITVRRPGFEDRIPFVLERENIRVHDLAYADYVGDGIGYFKLTSFSKNTDTELRKAFRKLDIENMDGMILDLRDNPGGLLSSALDVVELFVEPGIEVLSTRGRTDKANRTFETRKKATVPQDIPVAIMVNHGSASASEIVSGVLQDLDRAIIIGKSTFGKGLVQTVVPLSRESAIKVTTAKYYIPSGRLIQKQDYFNEKVIEDPAERDSIFYTQNHRKVFGGGGINPDIRVKQDTMPRPVRSITAKNLFFQFAVEYHNRHAERFWPFAISDSLYNRFFEYMENKKFNYQTDAEKRYQKFLQSLDSTDLTQPEIAKAQDIFRNYLAQENQWRTSDKTKTWIVKNLRREFAQMYGGSKARIRESVDHDNGLQMALNILNDQSEYRTQLGFASAAETVEN